MLSARKFGTRVYIAGMGLAALGCFYVAFLHRQPADPGKFVFYLVAAVLASSLKVSLPGIEGTMSMNFLLTLLCIIELGLPETLIIGLVKRVHVREELIDRETLRIRDERFHVVGRMASPHWYCRTRDRFEMVRPK